MMLLERKYNYVCNFAEQATSSDTQKFSWHEFEDILHKILHFCKNA